MTSEMEAAEPAAGPGAEAGTPVQLTSAALWHPFQPESAMPNSGVRRSLSYETVFARNRFDFSSTMTAQGQIIRRCMLLTREQTRTGTKWRTKVVVEARKWKRGSGSEN